MKNTAECPKESLIKIHLILRILYIFEWNGIEQVPVLCDMITQFPKDVHILIPEPVMLCRNGKPFCGLEH
jgi:hypothetical protein